MKSLIGMGYHGTHTPPVIQRNVLENPGWYTAYTPYQAEIAQGRLEALLNFQTMICDLTGDGDRQRLAAGRGHRGGRGDGDGARHQQDEVRRAGGRDRPASADPRRAGDARACRSASGSSMWRPAIWRRSARRSRSRWCCNIPAPPARCANCRPRSARRTRPDALVIVCADPLALALLTPPGEMGADVVVGSSQRFGVPMGFGGPHAGYLATRDAYKRHMPGRLVGVSHRCRGPAGDAAGAADARAAHPAREGDVEHLHLAGAAGGDRRLLRGVARAGGAEAHRAAGEPAGAAAGRCGARGAAIAWCTTRSSTPSRSRPRGADALMQAALAQGFNLRRISDTRVGIALDETVTREELTRARRPCWAADLRRRRAVDPGGACAQHAVPRAGGVQPATTPSTRCCATSSGWRRRTSR